MPGMPKELLEFLLEQYQNQHLGASGLPPREAPLDALDALLDTMEERLAARTGIAHFLEASRQFLLEHPPQSHIMLAQGFGMALAGGYEVSLVPSTIEDALPGALEHAPAIPITEGRSIRGQGGIQPTDAVAVTGAQPAPLLRNPRD